MNNIIEIIEDTIPIVEKAIHIVEDTIPIIEKAIHIVEDAIPIIEKNIQMIEKVNYQTKTTCPFLTCFKNEKKDLKKSDNKL